MLLLLLIVVYFFIPGRHCSSVQRLNAACGRYSCGIHGMLDMPRYLTMLRNAPNNLTRICFAKPTLPQYTGICTVAVAAIASALGPRNYVCGDGGRLTTPFE